MRDRRKRARGWMALEGLSPPIAPTPTALEKSQEPPVVPATEKGKSKASPDDFATSLAATSTAAAPSSLFCTDINEAASQLLAEDIAAKDKKKRKAVLEDEWGEKRRKTETGEEIVVRETELADLLGEEDAAAYKSIFGGGSG